MDVEELLEKRIVELKIHLQNAKTKQDYDTILNNYDIKMKKNNKIVSALRTTKRVKKSIIQMAIDEPEDIFDYDSFIIKIKTKLLTKNSS